MLIGSLEERQERQGRNNSIKLVTAALYEAKVKNDEVLRVLMKVCDIDQEEAMNAIQYEKFIWAPCRELYQYLVLEKGFDNHKADVYIHSCAKVALTGNTELSKLSPEKMFDAINKANK